MSGQPASIGSILIRGVERVKKQARLEFLCGSRAVLQARADYETLSLMAGVASAGIPDLPALFEKQRADLRLMEHSRRALDEQLVGYQARDLYHATAPASEWCAPHRASGRWTTNRCPPGLAQAVLAHPKVILLGAIDSPPSLLLATSTDSGVDAGATLKPILESHGGRGGGSPRIAQGTVADAAALDHALQALVSSLTS